VGDAKRRSRGVGFCIYCRSTHLLSDEHIVPFGLGGTLVLAQASCSECSKQTGAMLEQRLLRGHWWAYRVKLGLNTRNPAAQTGSRPVTLIKGDGASHQATIPISAYPVVFFVTLNAPSIITGKVSAEEPFARDVAIKLIGDLPKKVSISGEDYILTATDKIDYPVNFNAADFTRFLAKVAHGYAISRLGYEYFQSFFLPDFILGKTAGIMTYVGGFHSSVYIPKLEGGGVNRLTIRERGSLVSVCAQFFVEVGDPPPIYEVVVGEKKA
jgi:hypothetical protein